MWSDLPIRRCTEQDQRAEQTRWRFLDNLIGDLVAHALSKEFRPRNDTASLDENRDMRGSGFDAFVRRESFDEIIFFLFES